MLLHKNYPKHKRYTIPVGSTVTIKDGSYMFTYDKDNELSHWGSFPETHAPGLCRGEFVVLEHGNYGHSNKWASERNNPDADTKLVHLETGEVWHAVESVSLVLVKAPAGSKRIVLIPVEVPADGTPYTLRVDVSYQMPIQIKEIDIIITPTFKVKYIPITFVTA